MFGWSPLGVWIRIWAGPSVNANTGAWMLSSNAITIPILKILAMSARLSFVLGNLPIFPQVGQNSWVGVGGQVGQGCWGLGFLTNFSVVTRRIIVPMNISTVAPKAWKTWSAKSSPKLFPIARIVVIRKMFNAIIRGIPNSKIVGFVQNFPREI